MSPKAMAHHHPDGYYWHKEYRHSDWTVVRLHRSHASVDPVVTFVGRSDGTGRRPISLEELSGELIGPLRDPSAPNLHS